MLLFCSCGRKHLSNNQNVLLSLTHEEYTVTLKTVIDEGIRNIQWDEYGFSYPYILSQEMTFYHRGKCIKKHVLPVAKRQFKMKGKTINYQEIPIFDMELLQGSNGVIIHLYGADFCCGTACPEFNGLYLLDGTILSECISTMNQHLAGKKVNEIDVNLNNPIKRETLYTSFKPIS